MLVPRCIVCLVASWQLWASSAKPTAATNLPTLTEVLPSSSEALLPPPTLLETLMRLLLRGAGRTMALTGRWGMFPGDCGGEVEAILASPAAQARDEREGLERTWEPIKRCAVAKFSHAKGCVVDQRDEGRPPEAPKHPTGFASRLLAVDVAGEVYQDTTGYNPWGGNSNAAVSRVLGRIGTGETALASRRRARGLTPRRKSRRECLRDQAHAGTSSQAPSCTWAALSLVFFV